MTAPAGFREPPHNIEAEQALLGAILVNNDAYHRVGSFLGSEHFYEPVHGRIFATMARRITGGKLADHVLLWQLFAEDEKLAQIEGGAKGYLQRMALAAEAIVNAEDYGRVVRDLAIKRALVRVGEETAAVACNGYDAAAEEQLADARAALERLQEEAGPDTGRLPPLRALAADELAALELPPRESILGPWLQTKGLVMLYGPRGEGKTYLSLGAAIAVAAGSKFLCWEAPVARNVLLIDGEMPAQAMQERITALMRAAGITSLPTLRILTPDLQHRPLPNLASEGGQAEIEQLVAWADVVVLDNLACLCRSGDENERQPWLVTQGWLLALRGRGKSVVLVHHSGKTGDQRGTSAREDVLDVVVKLRRPRDHQPEDGLRAEWHFTKSRGFHGDEAKPIEVQLSQGRDGLTWTWCRLESGLASQVAEQLNETDLSLRDIAVDMGISKSYAHKLKKQAESIGLLRKKGVDR